MTGIGRLVQCVEDMEITQYITKRKKQELNFVEGVFYTALLEDSLVVIDRTHKPVTLTQELFIKHFKII
jgi:hypothetical protein